MPPSGSRAAPPAADYAGVAVPFRLATDGGAPSLLGTTAVFGTPVDITLSELAPASFFPADAETYEALARNFERGVRTG